MARRRVFTVRSPLGYLIAMTRDRWREIFRTKHPALLGHEELARECLAQPTVIRRSTKEEGVHLYYRPTNGAYLCVVVALDDGRKGRVRTVYFTDRIKKGETLWEL